MNKSVLALSTALSIFVLTPAFAQNSNSNNAGTNCAEQNTGTGSTTATDPNCVNKNSATQNTGAAETTTGSDQQQTQSGSTTAPATGDQNASGTTGTGSATTDQNAQTGTGTGTGATTTDQNANTGSSTTVDQNQNAQSGTSTTTDQNTTADSTVTTGTSNMSTDLIVPADRLNSAKLMSASDYIGKVVYDQAGANIGEVNDMILSDNGEIQAVILGVGGFLGIGEKNVAVAVPAVQMVQDGDNMRLVVQATKEQLEAAPSYDLRNRRYADDNNSGTMNTDSTSSTTTAPATGTDGTTNSTTGTGSDTSQ
jgi:sporulation protein YlmC with PRC-barrel domain